MADSPPLAAAEGCCFCFSYPKTSKKQQPTEASDWGKISEDFLTDASTFSVKEQEKRRKKAVKEEERIASEAERVVRCVKLESAKIDASFVDDLLRDEETEGKSGSGRVSSSRS